MKQPFASARVPPRRVGSALFPAAVFAAVALAVGAPAASSQDLQLLAPADGDGPGVDLWIESARADLEFGYWVSEPAYVAVFEVIPGVGTTLVVPEREGARERVEAGHRATGGSHYASLYRDEDAFARTLGGRFLSARHGYGVREPHRGYLLLVASRAPLQLWAFTRLDDYRYTASGLDDHAPYDAGIRTTAERLVELVVATPGAGAWSAAYVSYSLLPYADRYSFGHTASSCGYGLPGYGFLPVGAHRYGGYGIGLRSAHFPGYRSFGRAPYGRGIGLWSDPFGFGFPSAFGFPFGFASPFGLRSACGFGFGTFPFHRFRDPLFPPRPIGPVSPPVGGGQRTAIVPPPNIFRRVPTPTLERPVPDSPAAEVTRALETAPVPVRRIDAELELPDRSSPAEPHTPTEASTPAVYVTPTELERPTRLERPTQTIRRRGAVRPSPDGRASPTERREAERRLLPRTRPVSPRAVRPPGERERPTRAGTRARDPGPRSFRAPTRTRSPGSLRAPIRRRPPNSFRAPTRIRTPSVMPAQSRVKTRSGVRARRPGGLRNSPRIRIRPGSSRAVRIRRPARPPTRPSGGKKSGKGG